MPTMDTLERFIARVEENAHVEAVDEFYAENSSMQENQAPPRIGRHAHRANEQKVMANARTVSSQCIRPVFVEGDNVVIRWVFEFTWLDGSMTRIEELAYQRWDNEQIVEETFFFDPAQRIPKKGR